ncbi:MAG TPA: GNAT family N-acetyltransferase [Actinomycetota bacterium]|nr:GNAT family N-acetyltransferase [Actinomycetota bacterium]
MAQRIVDVTLENLGEAPQEPLNSVFWELDEEPTVEPRFEKEEWFSMALLEWGTCGKLAYDEEAAVAFAEYAPPGMFPRLAKFRCGRVSGDAIYLSYCYVAPERRGIGLGSAMVRAVARDLLERGVRAVEALGDREGSAAWVLPTSFLDRNGFTVVRDDARYPLMRLEVEAAIAPQAAEEAVAMTLPVPAPGWA